MKLSVKIVIEEVEEAMGVANKAWKHSGGVLLNNLAFLFDNNKQQKQKPQQQHCSSCRWPSFSAGSTVTAARPPKISWSVKVCGALLFAVGLISLFTGHLASDLEWYSQRLVKRTLYYKLVMLIIIDVDLINFDNPSCCSFSLMRKFLPFLVTAVLFFSSVLV